MPMPTPLLVPLYPRRVANCILICKVCQENHVSSEDTITGRYFLESGYKYPILIQGAFSWNQEQTQVVFAVCKTCLDQYNPPQVVQGKVESNQPQPDLGTFSPISEEKLDSLIAKGKQDAEEVGKVIGSQFESDTSGFLYKKEHK